MPTGYTAPVVDGKITKFADFAMSCARAFGALIDMRDSPMDAKIPRKIEPSPYHAGKLKEAQDRLARVRKMTPAQLDKEAQRSYDKQMEAVEEILASYAQQNERLDEMLKEAKSWRPPTSDHAGLKDFMIQQLRDSKSDPKYVTKPTLQTGQEWLTAEVERVERDIEYHARENAEEIQRANERTEWLRQLRTSLSNGE